MKQLLTRRAMITFVAAVAVSIAVTSYILGYSDGRINLASPFLILAVSAAVAFTIEAMLQSRLK
jgi:hypothetical protein